MRYRSLRTHTFTLMALVGLLLFHRDAAAAQQLRPDLALDGRWITLERVELGALELDTTHVLPMGPHTYQVRTRWQFDEVPTSPEGYRYRSSVAVRGIDCQRRMMAIIAFADHDGGRIVRVEAQPVYAARWDRVNPRSIVDRIATVVCNRAERRAVTASLDG